jgi:hypothetical protein
MVNVARGSGRVKTRIALAEMLFSHSVLIESADGDSEGMTAAACRCPVLRRATGVAVGRSVRGRSRCGVPGMPRAAGRTACYCNGTWRPVGLRSAAAVRGVGGWVAVQVVLVDRQSCRRTELAPSPAPRNDSRCPGRPRNDGSTATATRASGGGEPVLSSAPRSPRDAGAEYNHHRPTPPAAAAHRSPG